MRAVVSSQSGLTVAERPEPRPLPGEVVVRPLLVAASTADVHAFVYGGPASSAAGVILGSELTGVVEAVGEDAGDLSAGGLAVGDRVSVDPRHYCGGCMQCRAGFYSTCEREGGGLGAGDVDGALADLVAVRARNCYRLTSAVGDLQAALVPGVVGATHGVRGVSVGAGDNVGVFGLDEVGLATLQWVRPMTAGTVVALDALDRRRVLATRLGADLSVEATGDLAATVLDAVPEGLDTVFVSINEQVPSDDQLLTDALRVLRLQGSVVLTRVVGNRGWAALGDAPYLPLQREATIQNVGGMAHEPPLLGGRDGGDWVVTLEAFRRRRLDAERLDTEIVPFDGVRTGQDVVDVLRRVPTETSKVVFAMDGARP